MSCSAGSPSGQTPTACPGGPSSWSSAYPTDSTGRYWLVLARGVEPYGCLTDPLLDESRYVYVEAAMPALLALARGRCDWSDAFGDGSVTAAGDPDLVNQVAEWFQSTSEHGPSSYAGGRDA